MNTNNKQRTRCAGDLLTKTVFFSLALAGFLLIGCKGIPRPEKEPAGPLTTAEILARILTLLDQENYEGALALFERIDDEDADKDELRLIKASIMVAAGRYGEARSILEGLLLSNPSSIEALIVLANMESATGRTKEQQAALERIVKINPDHSDALASLGNIAAAAGSYRGAATYFDRALKANPTHGDALVGRAIIYRRDKNPKKAEEHLNIAIRAYPSWYLPLSERGRLYRSQGFPKEALADLNKAKALNPYDYWVAIDRGNILLDMRRLSEALEEYNRAIAMDPDNFLAYVYSAGIKDDLKDYAGAEHDYKKLIELKPEYYFAFEGLGVIKMRKSQWGDARTAFAEAHKYAPDNVSYALLLAGNSMRVGKAAEAKPALAETLRKVSRDDIEWHILRLYHDLGGDTDISLRIDREKDENRKARMLYYLAEYYAIRGNNSLADKLYLAVRDLNRQGMLEWKLNNMALEARHLKES